MHRLIWSAGALVMLNTAPAYAVFYNSYVADANGKLTLYKTETFDFACPPGTMRQKLELDRRYLSGLHDFYATDRGEERDILCSSSQGLVKTIIPHLDTSADGVAPGGVIGVMMTGAQCIDAGGRPDSTITSTLHPDPVRPCRKP